jgi:hypothetical protein
MRTEFWSEILKGRDRLEDLEADVRIILEMILGKERRCGMGATGSE